MSRSSLVARARQCGSGRSRRAAPSPASAPSWPPTPQRGRSRAPCRWCTRARCRSLRCGHRSRRALAKIAEFVPIGMPASSAMSAPQPSVSPPPRLNLPKFSSADFEPEGVVEAAAGVELERLVLVVAREARHAAFVELRLAEAHAGVTPEASLVRPARLGGRGGRGAGGGGGARSGGRERTPARQARARRR